MNKKLTILNILVLLTFIGLTYAYFSGIISGSGEEIVVVAKKVKVVFTDNKEFTNREIEPGWRESKTFAVENEGSSNFKYNLVFKGLQNTFVTEGFLKYKITSTNGGYNMDDFEEIPKQETPADIVLAYNISVDGGIKQEYNIEFYYENSDSVDQSEDMGQILKGTIFIEGGSEDPNITLATRILRDNDYESATERVGFNSIETSTKLWKAEVTENNRAGTTYYFTGNPNNWVSFAGYLWRIIRINEDGSVRLLYAGSGEEDGYIGISTFNSSANHPGYIGFKYALGNTLAGIRGTTESTILTQLNIWYEENIANKDDGKNSFDDYISREAVYCNDRELMPGNVFSISSSFGFAARGRLNTSSTINPTFNCTNEADRFTGSNLTYPVGLMTADEIVFAGGMWSTSNQLSYFYLNKSGGSATGTQHWFTMTPCLWGTKLYLFDVDSRNNKGMLDSNYVNVSDAIRPVISLKNCSLYNSGDGSSTSPYQVSINRNCTSK